MPTPIDPTTGKPVQLSAKQQAVLDSQNAQVSGAKSFTEAKKEKDENVAESLGQSTTINRYNPVDQTNIQAQQDINKKYNLDPNTGLTGGTAYDFQKQQEATPEQKQNLDNVVNQNWNALTPPQVPVMTGDKDTDEQAQRNYQSQLNAYKATVESRRQAQEFAAKSAQQTKQDLQSKVQTQPTQIQQPSKIPVENDTGFEAPEELPTVKDALVKENNQSMENTLSQILSSPTPTTSADLLKQSLIAQLGMIDDPTTDQILDNSAVRALQSYKEGLALAEISTEEINKAIDGTLEVPTTSEGLLAKIFKENKEEQSQSLQEEISYQERRHELQMSQLRDNRSRLEGFAKAKLASMGALDSSAGITVLTKMSQQADLQLEMADLDYDHNHQQLIVEGNKITRDFTNNVADLVMKINAQKQNLSATLTDQLSQIDEKRLISEATKKKDRFAAISKYYEDFQKLQEQQKSQEFEEMKFAYQQHQDAVKNAFDLSGMTGTIYVPDEEGGYKDTGIPTLSSTQFLKNFALQEMQFGLQQDQFTLDKQQFDQTYALDVARYNLSAQTERRGQVTQLLDLAKSEIDPLMKNQIEMMMGYRPGELQNVGNSKEDILGYINTKADQAEQQSVNIDPNVPTNQIPKEIQDIFRVGQVGDWCGIYASGVCTAPPVGNSWAEKISVVRKYGTIQDNPQAGYKLLLPLGVKTEKDYGHVLAVIGFDPKTNSVLCAQSNGDGRQNRGAGKGVVSLIGYNIDALKSKYGNNWGFVPGELKPEIQNQLMALSLPQTQIDTTSNYDRNFGANEDFTGFIDFMKFNNPVKKIDPATFQQEKALRDEFTKNTQNFVKIRDSYNTIQAASKDPSAAGDLSLIFAYMKVLDPGSTVREGEFANAQNAASVPTQVQNIWNKAITGERLSQEQRNDFISQAKKIYDAQKSGYDRQIQQTQQLADSYVLDPKRVIYDFANPDLLNSTTNSAAPKIQQATTNGYSSQEIIAHLLNDSRYNSQIQQAVAQGYSLDDIVNFLSQ